MATNPPPRKIRKLGENNEMESTDYEETQRALEEIDKYETELDNINEKAGDEIIKIEQKYNKLRYPIIEKRNEVISKIPFFWYKSFMNHPDLGQLVDDCEEDCLQHLTKIEVEEYEDIRSGFRISFHFDENPYFENTILVKEFNLDRGSGVSSSTEIKWKENFDIREQLTSSGKSSKKRAADHKSFFLWFNDNSDPNGDDVAELIKDDLWQMPLQFYLIPDMAVESGIHELSDEDDEELDNSENYAEEGTSDNTKGDTKDDSI